jgi:tRNA (mo5U34)-methyltransferase
VSGADLLREVRSRRWFYEFELPDGTRTASHLPAGVEAIHQTRRVMLDAALDHFGARDCAGLTAVDLACHQGWFALHLARRNFASILGVDARAEHLEDAQLMARTLGIATFATRRLDLEAAVATDIGVHDVTLMLGVLYHLENPVRALRLARAVTRGGLVIETQVVPHLQGMVEWGAEPRPVQGVFGVVDETAECHASEASLHGICLAPSAATLQWLLGRVGFRRIVRILAPPGGYDQLVRGSRVMFAAFVE